MQLFEDTVWSVTLFPFPHLLTLLLLSGTTYTFIGDVVRRGVWRLQISLPKSSRLPRVELADGAVVLFNYDAVHITSHLATYDMQFKVGHISSGCPCRIFTNFLQDQVGLVTQVFDSQGSRLVSSPTTSIVARMQVIQPDGESMVVDMHDDGLHMDAEPNDGIYGGFFEADEVGIYLADAIVRYSNI